MGKIYIVGAIALIVSIFTIICMIHLTLSINKKNKKRKVFNKKYRYSKFFLQLIIIGFTIILIHFEPTFEDLGMATLVIAVALEIVAMNFTSNILSTVKTFFYCILFSFLVSFGIGILDLFNHSFDEMVMLVCLGLMGFAGVCSLFTSAEYFSFELEPISWDDYESRNKENDERINDMTFIRNSDGTTSTAFTFGKKGDTITTVIDSKGDKTTVYDTTIGKDRYINVRK